MDNSTLLELFSIPIIDKNRKYWFVRTEGGDYYEEFKNDNYIAIGWDEYKHKYLFDCEPGDENELSIKEEIKERYKTERPGTIFNTLKRFMLEMSEGDIVFIPSKNSDTITFGEITSDMYIHSLTSEDIDEDRCEYIKRRTVKWSKSIERKNLDVNFYKIFQSHHTIVNADKYDFIIDRTLESFYIKNDLTHLTLYVGTDDPISGKSLFNLQKFIFDSKYFDSSNTNIKINVQSRGIIELIDPSTVNLALILISLVAITTGINIELKGWIIKFPGLLGYLNNKKEKNKKEQEIINRDDEFIYNESKELYGEDIKLLNVKPGNKYLDKIVDINNAMKKSKEDQNF